MQTSANLEYVESEKVKNVYGDELFKDLPRVVLLNATWRDWNWLFSGHSGKLSVNTGPLYFVNWVIHWKEKNYWTCSLPFLIIFSTWRIKN